MNAGAAGSPLFGGVEGGGTKFVCMVGSGPDDIRAERTIPTTTPAETLSRAVEFFETSRRRGGDRRPGHRLVRTGRPPLRVAHLRAHHDDTQARLGQRGDRGGLHRALRIPVAFDTDVNVAALGEWRWGAAQGLDTFLYLTVGTGIGGGGLMGGRLCTA